MHRRRSVVNERVYTNCCDRRVGPSVPDITLRSSIVGFAWWWLQWLDARPLMLFRLLPLAAQVACPPVHYTQLDARVAPRYVRQTAPLSPFLSSDLPVYYNTERKSIFSTRAVGASNPQPPVDFDRFDGLSLFPLSFHLLTLALHLLLSLLLCLFFSF